MRALLTFRYSHSMPPARRSLKPLSKDKVRRLPRQSRAVNTVELIFETTARIIQRDGIDGVTTNQIATECGISIGSLYQYFSNKNALLTSMAERDLMATSRTVQRAVQQAMDKGDQNLDEAAAQALLKSISPRHRVRRALVEYATRIGRFDILQLPLMEVERMYAQGAQSGAPIKPMSALQAFVMTSAVTGVLHAALMRDGLWLESNELAAEIARLARSYRLAEQ